MCLDVKEGTKVLTAVKDIVVYKKLDYRTDELPESKFQYHSYEKGVIQPHVDIKVVESTNFHGRIVGYEVHEGYHSYNNYKEKDKTYHDKNAIFVIPRGVQYIDGTFDGVDNRVSSTIIYCGRSHIFNRVFVKTKIFIKNLVFSLKNPKFVN